MKLSDFDYNLPKELIAQYPLKERDSARLLVIDTKHDSIQHRSFRDILDYLSAGDLLVLNDTKVLASRLKGNRLTGGKVELLLLNHKGKLVFTAWIKPNRVKLKERIIFNGSKISCTVIAKNEVVFDAKDIDTVYHHGVMPLPPYIKRQPQDSDNIDYQTVYAKEKGAVASPTAGLHFTKKLMQEIQSNGINIGYLTLHVGYPTFRPVKSEDITKHSMDKEYFKIRDDTLSLIEKTRAKNGRIFAVGTTSCRALETYALGKREGDTDLFIYPGYKFKMVDCLITNFHLPRTTLFMLSCAFAGEKLMKMAYRQAIDKKYRFYSYGDAMLIV
jgi:S-adenosylmethionine:tRNA ribosyltransferase-isomerase